MLPDDATCAQARANRRSEFDGVVFVAAGNRFCRPSCSSRVPAVAQQRYFASPAGALAAQLVPCERCDPLMAPRVPDHRLDSPLVQRAMRLIEAGALQNGSTAKLASRLGAGLAELLVAFDRELGATPSAIARANKAQQRLQGITRARGRLQCCLPVREPYDAEWVFEFLDRRSLPGLESVEQGIYRRRLDGGNWLTVSYQPGQLNVELPASKRRDLPALLGRVSQVFDVHADPHVIDATLAQDRWLGSQVTGGIRVPGAWDGFETAVRAILGQQVSVARARNLAIALMERFARDGFPTPEELLTADVSAIGMPGKRGEAVRALAAAVLEGDLQLDNTADPETQFETLCGLPGVGPWTAGYVAMRIAGDADAFPRGDWVILKQLGMTAGVAQKHSVRWAPYRSYALMYIWQASGASGNK